MTQVDTVYEYLQQNFAENEPIFLSQLEVPEMKDVIVRQQIRKLTEDGRLKRFDTGIYYLPKKSLFASGSTLSVEEVITRKYLKDGDGQCGYIGGIMFANKLGLTTQVPAVYEIYTNKATTDYRETRLADFRVILRRPYAKVDTENASTLQFMDLLKEVMDIAELDGPELTERLMDYMKKKKISMASIDRFLSLYPERIYKNMYEVGLLNGVSA